MLAMPFFNYFTVPNTLYKNGTSLGRTTDTFETVNGHLRRVYDVKTTSKGKCTCST